MKKNLYKPKKPKAPAAPKEVDPFFKVVASVYGVPETGIDAIDNQPYLNKDGRLYLLNELRKDEKGVKAIRVEFIKYSTNLNEAAVVKKIIEFKNDILVEAIGEASQDNVETKGVKTTLNMVAETRALNRAIWVAIAGDVMSRVENNLKTLEVSDADRARLLEAGRVSFEEMERPATVNVGVPVKLYEETIKRVEQLAKAKNLKELQGALGRVDNMNLNTEQKNLVKQRIEAEIKKLTPAAKVKQEIVLPAIQLDDIDVPTRDPKKKKTTKKAKTNKKKK